MVSWYPPVGCVGILVLTKKSVSFVRDATPNPISDGSILAYATSPMVPFVIATVIRLVSNTIEF